MWCKLVILLGLMGLLCVGLLWPQEKSPHRRPAEEAGSEEVDKPKPEQPAPKEGQEKISLELKTKIEKLIKQLGDEDWKVREEAQKELIKIGQPTLFPLIDILDSKDPEVRLRTQNILSQLEPELSDDEFSMLEEKLAGTEDKTKEILQELFDQWTKWRGIESGPPVNGLQLTIKSNKKVYTNGDPININFRLKNIGASSLIVNKKLELHFNLNVYFAAKIDKQPLSWLPPPMPSKITDASSFVILQPNKSLEGTISGIDIYRHLSVSQHSKYPEAGIYLIRFYYHQGLMQDIQDIYTKQSHKVWQGNVDSNTIEIEIQITPELQTEIEALIKQLGDEDWKVREEAQKELIRIGKPVIHTLIDTIEITEDAESKNRSIAILSQLDVELSDDEIAQLEKRVKESEESNKEVLWQALGKWLGTPVNGLRLSIKTDKKIIGYEESLTIALNFNNVGKEDIYICKNCEWAPYYFGIDGPEGPVTAPTLRLKLGHVSSPLTKNDFTCLRGEGTYAIVVKTCSKSWHQMHVVITPLNSSLSLPKPGKYQIKMKYDNKYDGQDIGLKAWTGEVFSNTITIEIKE